MCTYNTVNSELVARKFCHQMSLVRVPDSDHRKVTALAGDLQVQSVKKDIRKRSKILFPILCGA